MANQIIRFSEFPEDVQLCILSFLTPSEISSVACTSKRYATLCHVDSPIWFALCDRKWGPLTHIHKWCNGNLSSFKLLFNILSQYDRLIGFWRRTGNNNPASIGNANAGGIVAPLVFFEWGVSCVTGYRVKPCTDGSYGVIKSPFIWLSLSPDGEPLTYLKENPSSGPMELVRVSVNFIGDRHLVLEEHGNSMSNGGSPSYREGNLVGVEAGSPPDRLTSEMYRYFANRTSPGAGGERAWRRQRRKEKERHGRRRFEPEHLVKIVDCSPTPFRPLQGLWKGICDDMTLDFYHVAYDDTGGVACRRVGDSSKPFSGYAPVFWTSNATFVNSPLSQEEDYLYNTRMHLRPPSESEDGIHDHSPSRLMYINSSYELVLPNLAETVANPRHVEGRIWQYIDGTFGFGFLRNNVIVDLKHISQYGDIVDTTELYNG